MSSFRIAFNDQRKSGSVIRRQIEKKSICCIDGCGKPISQMTGPGSDTLCREHQLYQREYGGMGRIDRPYTFHRTWVCKKCGDNVLEYKQLAYITDEKLLKKIGRMLMDGHHSVTTQADGGDHSAENSESLCKICHAIETAAN